jgi:hypothetical protein
MAGLNIFGQFLDCIGLKEVSIVGHMWNTKTTPLSLLSVQLVRPEDIDVAQIVIWPGREP